MSKFEYADDAALVDADAATVTARVTTLSAGRWWYRRPRARSCISTARRGSAQRRRPRLKVCSYSSTQVRHLLPNVSVAARIEDTRRLLVWWWCDAGAHVEARWPIELCRRQSGVLLRLCWARCRPYVGNTPLENVYSFEYLGAECIVTTLTFVIEQTTAVHSARSPAFWQTTSCRAWWSWGRTSLLCVRRWHEHLKPGLSLSQWCAAWTGLTAAVST